MAPKSIIEGLEEEKTLKVVWLYVTEQRYKKKMKETQIFLSICTRDLTVCGPVFFICYSMMKFVFIVKI